MIRPLSHILSHLECAHFLRKWLLIQISNANNMLLILALHLLFAHYILTTTLINKDSIGKKSNECCIDIIKWQIVWDKKIFQMRHIKWDRGSSSFP